jgi:hypothetical protein
MKKVVSFLVLLFLIGCVDSTLDSTENQYSLKLSRKDLTKLFKGQELYAIRGVKSNFEDTNVRVRSIKSKNDDIMLLDFNKNYYKGANQILLHSNTDIYQISESFKHFIDKHKLAWQKIQIGEIQFKGNLKKKFTLIDIPNKESIEFGGNRFLQKITYNSKLKSFVVEESETLKKVDYLSCYDYDYNSLVLVSEFFSKTELRLNSFEAIKLVLNPVVNKIQLLIDFTEVKSAKKSLNFNEYLQILNQFRPINNKKLNKALQSFNSPIGKVQLKEITYQGVVNIYENIELNNVKLFVEKGTTINFYNDAKLIVNNSEVYFNGVKERQISIHGNGNNSIFFNELKASNFTSVVFSGLSNYNDGCKSLPSAVTFYNSKVDLKDCTFKNNKVGDDILNVFQSEFTIDNCNFLNVFSDAIDSDFSTGSITNTIFEEIGNDGVDCSGSVVTIDNSQFYKVSDKAISAGENSIMTVRNSSIKDSAIGFVSKDGSKLNISGTSKLVSNDLDFAVFTKKIFYDKPQLNISSSLNSFSYLIEKRSEIESLDVAKSLIYTQNVESKLYGKEYGKSSK